jgi:hypothetical protein
MVMDGLGLPAADAQCTPESGCRTPAAQPAGALRRRRPWLPRLRPAQPTRSADELRETARAEAITTRDSNQPATVTASLSMATAVWICRK